MKKEKGSVYKDLGYVNLDRKDILEIIESFTTILGYSPEININGYILDSLDELDEFNNEDIRKISISENTEDFGRIDLSIAKTATLLNHKVNDKTELLQFRVEKIIYPKENKNSAFLHFTSPILFFLFIIFLGLIILGIFESSFLALFTGIFWITFLSILIIISFFVKKNIKSKIIINLENKPSFWKKNIDDIIVNIIVGIVMLFIGLIINV